jgi:hypothetical protein
MGAVIAALQNYCILRHVAVTPSRYTGGASAWLVVRMQRDCPRSSAFRRQ